MAQENGANGPRKCCYCNQRTRIIKFLVFAIVLCGLIGVLIYVLVSIIISKNHISLPKSYFSMNLKSALFEIILFIYFYPLGRTQKHFIKKFHKGLLFTISNEYIWPKKLLIFMQGSKSAILAIFQSA